MLFRSDFDHYDWAAIKIGEKSISPLYSREVAEVLEEAGMQHCCVQIEWSFGDKGEKEHRLSDPNRIATNTLGEFLVADRDNTIKVFDSCGEFTYKIYPQVDNTVGFFYFADIATDVKNNTYILVSLYGPGIDSREVLVFSKTEMCKKFPVKDKSFILTVSHDRVFVASCDVIVVYQLNGTPICSFGEGTLSDICDIAAGSDGQIFVLNFKWNPEEKIAYVFTADGHQQNKFRVESKRDDYFGLAGYPSGEHIVFAGVERKTRRLKVAMYRKDGVFNRSVTLAQRVFEDNRLIFIFGLAIAVTNEGRVAIPLRDQNKVIVRPMKPCCG